jgi:hypothetical protein
LTIIYFLIKYYKNKKYNIRIEMSSIENNDPNTNIAPNHKMQNPTDKNIINYNKLKKKYDRVVKENSFLKDQLDSLIKSTKIFEENYKVIQTNYVQVKEFVTKSAIVNSEFNTGECSASTNATNTATLNKHASINLKNPEALGTNNPNNNSNMVKKIEDLEIHYNEMAKSFNQLVTKYKLLTEEKNKMEESSLRLLNRYSQLEKQYDETIKELYLRYEEIKRHKEIDKCLVNYTLNSFMLKTDSREDSNKRISNSNSSNNLNNAVNNVNNANNVSDPTGIKCEPIPTFAKFLAKRK